MDYEHEKHIFIIDSLFASFFKEVMSLFFLNRLY